MADPQGARVTRPPSMHDVARAAGVSHMTVSRVINKRPNVSEDARQQVMDAVVQLKYRPNSAARMLVTQRSRTIGVVTQSTSLFGPISILLSVENAARRVGYTVNVASVAENDGAEFLAVFEKFADNAVEGIVVIAPHVAVAKAAAAYAGEVPLVMVADAPGFRRFHWMSVNQKLGARLAVRHLVQLGHRDVAHLAGPADYFDGKARVQGWRQELRAHGLPPGRLLYGDWSADSGYQCGLELLGLGLPDAVFVGNDQMALGLFRALTDRGLSIPGDVSIVGFDDVEGSRYFAPALTTVRQDFLALGQQCVDSLKSMIDGASVPRMSHIEPKLLIRESTTVRR